MNKTPNYYYLPLLALCLLVFSNAASAQFLPDDSPKAKAIVTAMQNSAKEWNQGDLADFMTIYDPSATMMMPGGTVGLDSIRGLYQHKYFKGNVPKQDLRYSEMKVRLLGENYALLTGSFTLYGNDL